MARVAGYLQMLAPPGGLDVTGMDRAAHRLARLIVKRAGHCAFVLASGQSGPQTFVHPLFWGAYFVSIVSGRDRPPVRQLELMALSEVDLYPSLDALFHEAEHLDVEPDRVVTALLRLWRRAHPEDVATMVGRRLHQGELALVEHLTAEDLDGPLGDALLRARRFDRAVHDALSVPQWNALVDRGLRSNDVVEWGELWERLPAAVVPALMERGLTGSTGRTSSVLWRRFPFDLVQRCQRELEAGVPLEALILVLTSAPAARLAQLAPAIRERVASASPGPSAVSTLSRIVLAAADERPEGWLELHVLLMTLIEVSRRGGVASGHQVAGHVSLDEPAPRLLGRVVGSGVGRAIPVLLCRLGTEDRGVIIASSEMGFSPLGSRLRMPRSAGVDHVLAPLVEAMRASEVGPLICSVPRYGALVDHPMVIVQTDRGPWFEGAFPGGLRPWSAELTVHFQRMMRAALALAGRLQHDDSAVTLAHPVGHGWPLGLVRAVVSSLGEAAGSDGWNPAEVLIDGCCVRRDGAAFVRALDRAGTGHAGTAFELEPVDWAALGIDLPKDLAGVELFQVKEV